MIFSRFRAGKRGGCPIEGSRFGAIRRAFSKRLPSGETRTVISNRWGLRANIIKVSEFAKNFFKKNIHRTSTRD